MSVAKSAFVKILSIVALTAAFACEHPSPACVSNVVGPGKVSFNESATRAVEAMDLALVGVVSWRGVQEEMASFSNRLRRAYARGGTLVLYDEVTGQVAVADTSALELKPIGRRGAGPGEYENVIGVAVGPNGEVAIWDAAHGRISTFDSTGGFTWSGRFHAAVESGRNALSWIGPDTLALRIALPEAVDGGYSPRWALALFSIGTGVVDTVLPDVQNRGGVLVALDERGRHLHSMALPFAHRDWFESHRAGAVLRGDGDVFRIEYRPLSATRPTSIVGTVSAERIPRDTVESERSRVLETMGFYRPGWTFDAVQIPSHFAATSGGIDTGDSTFAIERIVLFGHPQSAAQQSPATTGVVGRLYHEFNLNGLWIGSFRMPANAFIVAATSRVLWIAVRDEYEDTQLRLYRREAGPVSERSSCLDARGG